MNARFFVAWTVVFVVWMAGSFVVHGLALHGDYARLPPLFRPPAEAQPYFPLMVVDLRARRGGEAVAGAGP